MSGHVRIAVQLWISFMVTACALAGQGEQFTAQGVVLGPDGEAVSGAIVSLYLMYDNDRLHEQLTTDQDGKYEFMVRAHEAGNSSGLIVVHKAGLAWNCRRWLMLDDSVADISLDQPKEVAGVVVNDKGNPVAGANVSLHALQSSSVRGYIPKPLTEELFSTETDSQGRFRLMTLSADWQMDFQIEAPGYATVQSQYLPDGQYNQYAVYTPGQTSIQFILRPEARIHGTVVRDSNGQPIVGANVRISRTESGVIYGFDSATSDRVGQFSFRGIPEGDFWVGAVPSHGPGMGWVGWPVPIRTQAGEVTTDIKLELSQGGVLEVKVVDTQGIPVEGAGVTVHKRGGSGLAQSSSDTKGLCRIHLPAGAYSFTEVAKWGFHAYEPAIAFDIEQKQTIRRQFTLKKADQIHGIVVDEAGNPVPDVRVALMPSQTEAVLSDRHGRFTMTWVKRYDEQNRPDDNTYELIAMDLKGGRAGTLKMQGEMEGLRLELKPAVTITGAVVDSKGKPIERASVSSWLRGDSWGMNLSPNKRCLTDRSGRFAIRCVLPDRTCNINVQANGTKQVKKIIRTPMHTEPPFDVGRIELVSEADTDFI
ncbi:MAG: carboxypeptidase-like regulatory domain-containing protein, partial [Phycisphaerae bacterium]|nr:carboxypeptidase-like regulatory domain-containing protein [Phycisphaerae bacterium]